MLTPFENMPDNARLWIYQADRKLTDAEIIQIEQQGEAFFEKWAAHGAPLKCSFKISHQQFLIISVDESYNMASGCSIDSSVGFVKKIEQDLGVNFFDRSKIAFVLNDEVYLESLTNLKSQVESGIIGANTLTFNNVITNKKELESGWIVPAKSTWLGKYFN